MSASPIRSQSLNLVTLIRGSRPGVDLPIPQVTAANCRRIFHVPEAEIWLKDDIDGSAFFPSEDGTFEGLVAYQTLLVQGEQIQSSHVASRTLNSTPTRPLDSETASGSAFRSVTRSSPSPVTYNLKVIKATMKKRSKKVTFDPIHQMYLEIKESTANVHYISLAVTKKWGKGYMLVTNDGLQLEDTEATRG